jgi:hypothetical protein
VRAALLVTAAVVAASTAYADAPAAKPSPKPRPSPSPIVEPFDLVPTDPPEPLPEAAPPPAAEPAPLLATPAPSPSPDLVARANARSFRVQTELGAMVSMTGESGTDVTPTFTVDADGPLALGSRKSWGRLGARLGLSSSPGEAFNAADVRTYRAVDVGLSLGRVIGVLGDVSTMVLVEGTFSTRLKGSSQPAPRDRLVRSAGLGLRFMAGRSNASLTAEVGYDEATASCAADVVCTGVHSGPAFLLYGQVPIIRGAVLFGGDVSLSTGQRVPWVKRRDIERITVVVDPVAMVNVIRGQ